MTEMHSWYIHHKTKSSLFGLKLSSFLHFIKKKNEKGAIEISVLDVDKNLAAEIANAVVNKLDETNRDLLNENKKKILAIYKKKKIEKEQEVKNLTDTIFDIKQRNNYIPTLKILPLK